MPYITVDRENSGNIDLYYEDHGSGRPVVLVHGWPLSGASWEKQVPALLDAGCRVITYDRRGFGKSSQPTFGYDYDTMAEDLHKLITKLDLRDIALVGFSMGGGEVARYLGAHGSERVSRAVFIAAIPPYMLMTTDNPEGIDGSVFEGMKKAIVADRAALLSKFLSDFYNVDLLKGKKVSDEAVHLSWIVAAEASPKGTLDCVTAFSSTDFRDDLKRIDIPTLVIHGDADRICLFPATGKRTPEFVKGAKLFVVNGGPHGINWTHAEEVNRSLVNFLGEAARKKAAA
ncbi:MAG: alpha/beta hydrolase [Candidatus Manganitrophus sp.]|nr:alpha/beta hydrolase [Candidatus Manganitrophus sp.]MDC4227865.1 alpha/beta hydrolase [Candidatus Manganitrophus sp.]WDT70950.1 MAG: alpha/beta hydrolase [Candidatus Manganitrophus sp.]WDT81775.1 MAG: alpha/beta hydrolase [Candidatus Manganitrophus sp.]